MAQSVCQKTCIVIASILGVLAGLAVLIIGYVARLAYKAAIFEKTLVEGTQMVFQMSVENETRENVRAAFKVAEIVVIVLIALGCIIILTNFIGCYGALCSSLYMTYFYFVFQILLMCVSISLATLLIVGQEELISTVENETNCDICDSLVGMVDFATPVGGVFIFAALCQALTIYCAWVVAQKIKDGSLTRTTRKGMVMFQPPSTTTVVVTR